LWRKKSKRDLPGVLDDLRHLPVGAPRCPTGLELLIC
jgi:hypothetical protein